MATKGETRQLFHDDLVRPESTGYGAGYPATPGTGPLGKACKTCAHAMRFQAGKSWAKCWIMKHWWTSGAGTDIKLRTPACIRYQEVEK